MFGSPPPILMLKRDLQLIAVILALLLAGCYAPPIRTSFLGAPGRRNGGDGEINAALGVAGPGFAEVSGISEVGGAYAFTDMVAAEAGAVGGGGGNGGFMGGYGGVRLTFPRSNSLPRTGLWWDVELGGGAYGIFANAGAFGGGYTGIGVAYRWEILSIYGRLRLQSISNFETNYFMWNSLALGTEWRLGKRVDLFWAVSESLYLYWDGGEPDYVWEFETADQSPAIEIGLAIRI